MNTEKSIEEEQFEEDPYLGVYCLPINEVKSGDEENYIEVEIYQDVYKEGKIANDYILVKKDVLSKQTIYKDDINDVKEIINKQGKVRTTRVELNLRHRDPIVVKGNYNKFKSIIFTKPKQESKSVGFKFY